MDIETDYNCGFSTQFFKVRFFCLLLFGTFDMHNALGRYFIVWYEAVNLSFSGKILAITSSPVQTGATLLDVTCCVRLHPCCMLLDVVVCCCAKFETGQTFQPTTPNISFVPWWQQQWRNNVGSCCVRLHAALKSLHSVRLQPSSVCISVCAAC